MRQALHAGDMMVSRRAYGQTVKQGGTADNERLFVLGRAFAMPRTFFACPPRQAHAKHVYSTLYTWPCLHEAMCIMYCTMCLRHMYLPRGATSTDASHPEMRGRTPGATSTDAERPEMRSREPYTWPCLHEAMCIMYCTMCLRHMYLPRGATSTDASHPEMRSREPYTWPCLHEAMCIMYCTMCLRHMYLPRGATSTDASHPEMRSRTPYTWPVPGRKLTYHARRRR